MQSLGIAVVVGVVVRSRRDSASRPAACRREERRAVGGRDRARGRAFGHVEPKRSEARGERPRRPWAHRVLPLVPSSYWQPGPPTEVVGMMSNVPGPPARPGSCRAGSCKDSQQYATGSKVSGSYCCCPNTTCSRFASTRCTRWRSSNACPRIPSLVPLIAYQVHERPNGRGYPRGQVRRTDSSLPRVLSVADTYPPSQKSHHRLPLAPPTPRWNA